MRSMIEPEHPHLSVRHQCRLLGVNRSTLYYEAAEEAPENLRLMRLLDQEYTAHPNKGSRTLTQWLFVRERRLIASVCND